MTHLRDRMSASAQPRPARVALNTAPWVYLAQEAVLFLALSYVLLLGGTFNGLVLYRLNVTTTVVLAAAGALYLAWHWLGRRPFPGTVLDRPLLALLAAYALSTVFSADPRRSVGALLLLALYVLLYYLVVDLLRAGWPAALFIKVLVLVSGFIVSAGLWELLRWYGGWLAIAGPGEWAPAATLRVRAFLGHPNFVAAYFTLLAPLGLTSALRARGRVSRVVLGVWTVLAMVLVFFTSSRAGWLGCVVSLAALAALLSIEARPQLRTAWRWLRQRPRLMALIGVAVLVLGAVGAVVLARQLQHPSHGGRLDIWRVAWEMLARRPLVGNGPFTFGTEYIRAYSVPPILLLAHAHSYPLNTLAETGLLGGGALALAVWAFGRTAKRRWEAADRAQRLLLAGPLAALAGTAVNSLLDTPQSFPAMAVITAVLVALLTAEAGGSAQTRPPRVWHKALLTAGWLLVVGALAWSLRAYAPFSRGALAGSLGHWAAAAPDLDTATQIDPAVAHYWFQAGYVHGQLALADNGALEDPAELNRALAAYERGVTLEPAFATNWANLGLLRWAGGDQAGALAALQTAADRAPQQPAFRLTLGRMHEAVGRSEAAAADYKSALAVAPAWAESYFFRATPLRQRVVEDMGLAGGPALEPASGWAALDAGDFALARERFQRAAGINTPEPYLGLGLSYFGEGRLTEAELALRMAQFAVDTPGLVSVRIAFALGRVHVAQGQPVLALADYRRALDTLWGTTSFGVGTLGSSQYAWYVFNRESVAPDLLPGIDFIVYTDDLVLSLVEMGDLNREQGQDQAATAVYCLVAAGVPDAEAVHARLEGRVCP